jgi:hypothetical protein
VSSVNGHHRLRDDFAHTLELLAASDGHLRAHLAYRFRMAENPTPRPLLLDQLGRRVGDQDEFSSYLVSRGVDRWQLKVLAKIYNVPLPVELEPVRVLGHPETDHRLRLPA